jgi:hypothetical protein
MSRSLTPHQLFSHVGVVITALLLRILEAKDSSFGPKTGYSD